MSPIAEFQTSQRAARPGDDGNHNDSAPARPLVLKARVAASRGRLTRELAAGTEPSCSPELALRASQLTSNRLRKQVARTLRRTVSEAHRPRLTRSRVVIINRSQVIDAEDAINTLIGRLGDAQLVRAEGMALAELILTDVDMSQLYNAAERGALRRQLLVATKALDIAPRTEGELAIAA
ncbi:MAG TPA: hypothetical protein VGL78_08845 [Solirubrobacteraceae bacterium]|jgi:hypothetical protein